MSTLQALNKPKCNTNTTYDTHTYLNQLAQDVNKIRITWIKAHAGHAGNELADEYAKIGVTDTTNAVDAYITSKGLTNPIEIHTYHKWKEKWTSYKHCRQTKIFYPHPRTDRLTLLKRSLVVGTVDWRPSDLIKFARIPAIRRSTQKQV